MANLSDSVPSTVAVVDSPPDLLFPRLFSRFIHFFKILAPYVTVQLMVQLMSSAVGILIIRSVTQREYAIFTIAMTIQGTLISLADIGISSVLSGIGGRVWQDPYRFGQLVKTGFQMRTWISCAVLAVSIPVMAWMFLKNGVSIPYTIAICVALLMGAGARLTTDILMIVPKIKGQVKRLQNLDLIGALLRVGLIGVLYLTTMNAFTAVLTASIASYIQNLWLVKRVKNEIVWEAPPNEDDKAEMTGAIKKQFLNTLYYCAQGQITIAVISVFGRTNNIAEIGALGKLSVIFTLIGSVFANLVMPRFAREQSWRNLIRLYVVSLAVLALLSVVFIGTVILFPGPVLWILGPGYSHLRTQLVYSVVCGVMMAFTGLIFGMNAARGWFGQIWLTIPIMLVCQITLAYTLDLRQISNVMLLSSVPYVLSCVVPLYTLASEIRKMKNTPAPGETN